jgi:hypothetical protein
MALTPTEQVVERLAQCWHEITGVRTRHTAPPQDAFVDEKLPAAVLIVRGLTGTSFTDPSLTQQTRAYVCRLFVSVVDEGTEVPGLGAEKYQEAVAYLDRAHVYFINHRDLSTTGGIVSDVDTQAGLGVVVPPLHTLTDTGIVPRTGPGGAQYWTIEFNHQITVRLSYCFEE